MTDTALKLEEELHPRLKQGFLRSYWTSGNVTIMMRHDEMMTTAVARPLTTTLRTIAGSYTTRIFLIASNCR